jgi:glycosyltransferase involved in cell wall biosynthesis
MKIAIWHNLPSGGGRRALFDQVRGLVSAGHEVAVWCPPQADRSFLPLDGICLERVVPMARGLAVRGPLSWVRSGLADRLGFEAHCRRCASEMEAEGFDVVLAHSCQFHRAMPIARYTSLPSALYQHEPFRWLYEAMPRQRWEAEGDYAFWRSPSRVMAWLRSQMRMHPSRHQVRWEREDAQAFDRILVNSLFSRESVLRAYGLDARVCRLGVDATVFSPPPPGAVRRDVVGLGAFVPEKGVETVIRAIGRIRVDRPALDWIGNVAHSGYLDRLAALAANLGVVFRPHLGVPQAQVLQLLRSAACLGYAPRLEPFGYAPLEAGACATAVAAIAEAGVRETVVDGANGLLAENDEQLAVCIERIVSSTDLAQELGAEGYRRSREVWSLEAAAGRLSVHLSELVAARGGGRHLKHGEAQHAV